MIISSNSNDHSADPMSECECVYVHVSKAVQTSVLYVCKTTYHISITLNSSIAMFPLCQLTGTWVSALFTISCLSIT